MSRNSKDPLSRVQRSVLTDLVNRGGQLPAYQMRENAGYTATRGTRNALARAGYIELGAVIQLGAVIPYRSDDGQKIMLDAAQITRAGIEALNWPNGGGPHWAHMLGFAEAGACAEHEARHPARRNYRDDFMFLLDGKELHGAVGNRDDVVEITLRFDAQPDLHIYLTGEQAQHLSGTIAAAWSAARTYGEDTDA